MSTWIESHQDLRSNPKTRRAARQLGTTVPALMGHLHCLWHWALDHAEDGDVSPFDSDDLADAAGWEGDAGTFVEALTECGPGEKAGFLEPDGLIGDPADGKRSPLALHDWWEYAGKLIAKRRRDAERKARARNRDVPPPPDGSPEGVHGTSDGQDADGSADVRVTAQVPNRTVPNTTEDQGQHHGAARRDDLDGMPLQAEPDLTFAQTLGRWVVGQGVKLPAKDRKAERYAAVLDYVIAHIPEEHPKRRGVVIAFIADYVGDVTGEAPDGDTRGHLARLVGEFDAQAVMHAAGEAVGWGAGIGAEYANDPKAFTKYMARILYGERQTA